MTKKERYKAILAYFEVNMPAPETELIFSNPYELLTAVILSAQCTDKRVNIVTAKLFKAYPSPEILAQATSDEVFAYIRSISYPNNKAKHLVGMAKILVNEFNSVVPESIEDLQKMPGVGRKTANVIASVVYNKPTMAVDTHVFRVSKRIGFVPKNLTTPLAVEKQLVAFIPKAVVPRAHHWLILHGRYTCMARNPNCAGCGIANLCKENLKKMVVSE